MDEVCLDQLEPSKENIQPLARGRAATALRRALQEQHIQPISTGLDAVRLSFEMKLDDEEEDDPLAVWIAYIAWLDENYPSGYPDLPDILLKCGRKFQEDQRYVNSLKYLKVWIRYVWIDFFKRIK
jgi:hypothetical protein